MCSTGFNVSEVRILEGAIIKGHVADKHSSKSAVHETAICVHDIFN